MPPDRIAYEKHDISPDTLSILGSRDHPLRETNGGVWPR